MSSANQNKPFSWYLPELSIRGAGQEDRSSGYENGDENGRHKGFNVCACEKRDLVKPRFWKRAWISLKREVNYFKNKFGDRTIFF